MNEPTFKIGIEEEYQLIHPETLELHSYITQILDKGQRILGEQLKPEMHQAIVEVVTTVCEDVSAARSELIRLRRSVIELADKENIKIIAAGTHPFSSWEEQAISPQERYLGVRKDMQVLADQLLIFGTHVHIGIEDRDFMIEAMNAVRYYLPHFLCLSASSPFWIGRNTGLKSYRSIIFRGFPRTGIPRTLRSWREYEDITNALINTQCIPDGTKIWWDIRPNWKYPTLEIRICDVSPRIDTAICIAALFQALVYKLWKLHRDGMSLRIYPTSLIEENKWRAVRYGLDASFVDWGKNQERPAREMIRELIEDVVGDVIDTLGSREAVEYAYRILEEGTSADRQLATFQRTGNLQDVVQQLIQETRGNL